MHIYSPKTKIINKKNPPIKERFTKLTQHNSSNLEQPLQKVISSQKNIKKIIHNKNTTLLSSSPSFNKASLKTNIPLNKTNSSLENKIKNKQKLDEIKNKFKELSKELVLQIDAFESSSKQIDSLYKETCNYKEITNLKISSFSQSEKNNNLLDADIVRILQKFLFLPENQEDIIVLLYLSPKGDILSLKIEKSNSLKNSEYCIKEIPKLPFRDILDKHKLTKNILFRIKLTT